jgi:type VI secretion system ImpC/EvpB family protein
MAGRLEFDIRAGRPSPSRDGMPMRLLVLGDFGGTAAADRPPLATRPTRRLDPETLDEVMLRLAPRLAWRGGEVVFHGLDDFHPDRLYARLPMFKGLREARDTPGTADDDLRRLLGGPADAPPSVAAPARGLDALIRDIVAPHIVKDTSVQARIHRTAVDTAIAEHMRTLLHEPAFQSLEAAWRGVQWLISSLELDEHLQLHLFDVTREELLADVVDARGRLAGTGIHRALVDRWRGVPGEQGWSVLVALMDFGASEADVVLLAALGLIASHAGGPLLAGADPVLAGEDAGDMAAWQALRGSDVAPWIGLASPRVLLRLPYGKGSDPIEGFAFEEFAGAPPHGELLWGSASLATALLIGRAFTARGWDMEPGDERDIGDMPAYTFVREGERELLPCAERLLTEPEIHALLRAGLIPVAGRRDRNGVAVIRFQSISDPPAPLAW